jgi:hypothetical protein
VLSNAYNDVRWTADSVELIGRWDGETFELIEFNTTFPREEEEPALSPEPTPGCDTVELLTSYQEFLDEWQRFQGVGRDPRIVSAARYRTVPNAVFALT